MTTEQMKLLKTRLKANRWNLSHLAKSTGISQPYLSQIINNKTPCKLPIAIALATIASEMTGVPYYPSDFTNTTTEN